MEKVEKMEESGGKSNGYLLPLIYLFPLLPLFELYRSYRLDPHHQH